MMQDGMLWYDSHMEADIAARVAQAVDYFKAKYGCVPTTCYIHPDMLPEDLSALDGIKILPSARVLRNHIWIEFPLAE